MAKICFQKVDLQSKGLHSKWGKPIACNKPRHEIHRYTSLALILKSLVPNRIRITTALRAAALNFLFHLATVHDRCVILLVDSQYQSLCCYLQKDFAKFYTSSKLSENVP